MDVLVSYLIKITPCVSVAQAQAEAHKEISSDQGWVGWHEIHF